MVIITRGQFVNTHSFMGENVEKSTNFHPDKTPEKISSYFFFYTSVWLSAYPLVLQQVRQIFKISHLYSTGYFLINPRITTKIFLAKNFPAPRRRGVFGKSCGIFSGLRPSKTPRQHTLHGDTPPTPHTPRRRATPATPRPPPRAHPARRTHGDQAGLSLPAASPSP